jgi:hypothetical protein
MEIADIRARADYCFRRAAVTSHPEMRVFWKTAAEAWEAAAYRIGQPNEVTQLSCGRDVDRATLLKVVEGSMKIDEQYDRDTGAMLFQLHRYATHPCGAIATLLQFCKSATLLGANWISPFNFWPRRSRLLLAGDGRTPPQLAVSCAV